MKTNRRNPLFRSAALSAIVIVATQTLHAATGTWNVNANGNWSLASNWTPGIADGSGSTANFVFNITADRTVTLDGSRTLTTLTFTDATTASHNWILNNSNSAVLTLAGTAPGFNVTNRTATISAPVAGTDALTKTGPGTLVLSGANTFNAGITTINGPLQLNSNTAAGSGAITISTTTGAAATRLVINGGVTIANPVTINPHVGVANTGSLQHAGTGQGRINGAITITSGPSVGGGNFFGGAAVGSELVLGGAINSTVPSLSQRDGRVTYAGGGSGGSWNNLLVTNTALVGATDGIPTGVTVTLGGSGSATLDLNGFDQSLNGLVLGNVTAANNFTGTVNLGAKTLSLTGNITSQSVNTQNVTHRINATAGGALDLGPSGRTVTLTDTLANDDLAITGAAIKGSGLTKEGDGTLALSNVAAEGTLTINAGTLATSGIAGGAASTITTGALAFGVNPTGLRMKIGPASDLITAGSLTTSGTTTVTVNQSGGLLANGTYPLIAYSGTSPGLTGFALSPIGHATASLVDSAGAISLQVTGNDSIIWDGTVSDNWVGANNDWKRSSNSAATNYIEGDVVIFNDLPVSSNVILGSNVTPSSVTFNNTSATAYSLSGIGSIIGTTGLTKNGNGELTIANPNAYSGPTTINAGSILANFSTGSAIPAASSITMATGTSLTLGHNGGLIALTNPFVVGAGTLTIDPNLNTAGNRDLATVTWDASGFAGTMRLSSTVGTMRVQVNAITDVGSGPIEITNGGQLYINTANLTFPNNFTISGTGWTEGAGNLGAIRTSGTTNLTGTITVAGTGKIGALGGTAVVSNTLSGGDLTFGGSINNTGGETLAITGNASGLTSLTVNDGSATSAATSVAVNVGNGTASGTIGAVPVFLKADGFKNAVIRFDRSDGYTLGGAISSAATSAANEVRNFIDFDSTGTGFSDNGLTISLGLASPAAGGRVRVGVNRANALATVTGTLTSEVIQLAGGQNNATLNINGGANISTNQFYVGDSANNSGTVNQATGSTVNVLGQVRLGHFGTNTSTYNLNGGTLTLSGDSPNASPSTATGGAANQYGDNNLNTLTVNTILGGGIYLGNDGTGIFNHIGGTLTTNWIVLDNRGDSVAGLNMPDGIDRYNLSGTGLLKLRSTYGLIARNTSTDVSFGGGTVQVDNSGTGPGTGADLNIPLDATLSTVASTTTTLDTNGAGNSITLARDVNGSGTLALTGGGAINFNTAGFQTINAALTGSNPVKKIGTGTTILAGPMAGLTGTVTVDAGILNIPASLNTTVTVNPGGSLAGEISLPTLNLNGGTVLFDPTSGGSLAVNTLNLNVNSFLDVSAAPGVGTFTALTYTNKTGIATLAVSNSSDFRNPPVVNDTSNSVNVTYFAGKALTWTGADSGVWDIKTANNWSDGVNSEKFFSGDSVTFPEAGSNPAITLTGPITPAGVSVTSDTTNYTFTSTAGNLITGTTGLSKSGTSTLTLVGENTYSGNTTLSGGVLVIDNTNNIGNGVVGNGLILSGGGKLSHVGNAAVNLGVNRSIAVGTGGAVIEHNNATAAAISIPGNLSGTGALSFLSAAAGGGTYILAGNNIAYTGDISVSSVSTGLTTLRIENPGAAPTASSITVNYPAAGANGNANTLNLFHNTVLPAATVINLMSALPTTALSLRSQITSAGNATINGPIKVAGDTIVQVSPAAGSTLTLNGNIGESSPGSFAESPLQTFTNVLFLRGSTTSTIIVNGQINLPSAGSTVAVTDGATAIINSTGSDFRSASAAFGTIRLGATNAIPTTARLVIGQGGNQDCTLDLNGFDQTVSGLEWQATSATINKGISNTHPTNTSTFTINQLAAPAAANFSGTFKGSLNLVKEGPATTTLSTGLSTFTGAVTVNAGTLIASGIGANNGANSALGVANLAGRTVTVNPGATLSFTTNNVFGNGVGNVDLPVLVINGGTLTSTRYNALGNVTLNGATLTQGATDGPGAYEGYQFLGSITVGGSAASTISSTNGRANHLGAATQFVVADAIGGADLTVSADLKNPSADIGGIGSLTKSGPGTMVLGGVNTYTGDTVVNGGSLELADNAQLRFVIGAASGTNNSLTGSGTVLLEGDFAIDTSAAAALNAGTWLLENVTSLGGAYGGNFQVVNTDGSPWSNTGDTWTRDGGGGKTWSFDETTGTLTLSQGAGYVAWAAINAGGQDPNLDFDLDGVQNGVEFFMGETGSTFTANPTVVTTAGVRTVTWPKSASFNGTYKVETSETLVNWTNVTGSVVDNGSSVVYTLPTGSPKVFVRLVVTPN